MKNNLYTGHHNTPLRLLFAAILLSAGLAAGSSLSNASVHTAVVPSAGHQAPLPQDVADVRANAVSTNDQQEPTLAVDPTNPNNIIAAAKDWRTGPKQVWDYHSTDGGKTWADSHLDLQASELPNQSDPVLAFDAQGTAYMSVIAYNQNDLSVGGIVVARSTDVGQTWSKPTLVSADSKTLFNDKEWLTIDRGSNPATHGNIYVTWTLFTTVNPRTERGDIFISRSTDGGKTFSARKLVSSQQQGDTQGSFPAIGPNGEVYVLYYSGSGAVDADSAEQGAEAPVPAPPAQTGRDSLWIARSTDGGQTFGSPRKVATVVRPNSPLPNSHFRLFVLPVLMVDPKSGEVYATWNDAASGISNIQQVHSTDGGQTWSAQKRVNDDPSPNRDHFFPYSTAGSDGTLHTVWLDRRDDPANKRYRPYYSRSTDGGATYSANMPLTAVSSDPDVGFEGSLLGDYIAVDTSADGSRVYAAWVDTRNGDQDIYFSTFSAHGASPQAASTVSVDTRLPPVAVPSPQPLTGFDNEAFLRRWESADRPVLVGKASRAWLWGPVSFAAARESYAQGVTGTREVQYFDKARMEINKPSGDPTVQTSPSYVTNGLLVVELISGRIQIGDAQFEPTRTPSQQPVAGDVNSPSALTYASLVSVASLNNDKRATDRTGQTVTATLDRSGDVRDDPARGGQVKLQRYEPTLGHNIPDVFWTFMNSRGPLYNSRLDSFSDGPLLNWIGDLGYPITEPYWTNVKIGATDKWVLVQAFQRRVLTYVADNPPATQVEMGNVGRHYFDWRYSKAAAR
ncbi:MAG: glycoside hydrolase [Chloroflexota bacterium]|nr:glycoside hydrolase [Chloroflexota bacterium]